MRLIQPEAVGMSSDRLTRLHAFINGYLERGELAGAVTVVARDGHVVHAAAQGFRWREVQAPMSLDTIFSLRSMTKPIVSTALMMLWEEGHFRLDDPIATWLPAWAGAQVMEAGRLAEARPITIRHVLTHTSGVRLTDEDERDRRGVTGLAAGSLQEVVERAATLPLRFQPGTAWHYGESTDIVAALVERISGLPLETFLHTRIFTPLGMVDTHYHVPRDKVTRLAAVYSPGPDGRLQLLRAPAYQEPSGYCGGVGGLHGTASDYLRFCQMLLNGGALARDEDAGGEAAGEGVRLLGRMTVNQMFTNQIGTDKPVYLRGEGWGFGLGAGVLLDPARAQDAFSPGTWSWGGSDGTLFYIDPREQLVALLMVQLNPYAPSQIRPRFSNVVSQAVIDANRAWPPPVLGYQPLA